MNVYLIACEGQGDERAVLVDKETWDWINDPWSKPPAAMMDRRRRLEGDFDEPNITKGSAVNDAALFAPGIEVDGLQAKWYDGLGEAISDARFFAQKHGFTIVEQFDGVIY